MYLIWKSQKFNKIYSIVSIEKWSKDYFGSKLHTGYVFLFQIICWFSMFKEYIEHMDTKWDIIHFIKRRIKIAKYFNTTFESLSVHSHNY